MVINIEDMCQGQLNAYVAGGKDKDAQLKRLKEVPDEFRNGVILHMRTIRDIKNSVIAKNKK